MADRLFVSVLGTRKAGKSHTWNTLFGETVRTGKHSRRLELGKNEFVEVFLISGSNEERKQYAGDILRSQTCRIILCSMQYIGRVSETIQYIRDADFAIYTQWLNPGFADPVRYDDHLGIFENLNRIGATMCERSGRVNAAPRVQEIREFIYGWAIYRGLIVRSPENGAPPKS
jgi:hypothetical protein